MRITIINKSNRKLAGNIKSPNFTEGCFIDLKYQKDPKVIKEIQEVLLKYYELKYISGEGGISGRRNKWILPEVK